MAGPYRVFLSAVTSEFGAARDRIAADLRSRGLAVGVQSDFRAEAAADTLLDLLHNYIREGDAVVCVVGRRSGAGPTAAEAAPHRATGILPDGIAEASYTQWELFFARHHRKRLSLYFADAAYAPERPDPPPDDRPELQRDYVRHIEHLGLHRIPFATAGDLRAEILREDWGPHLARGRKVFLPYPSLGGLFKGRDDYLRRLRDGLTAGGQAAITSQAVHGLGGIGKTRAAVEYAHAHADAYGTMFLVVAETAEALNRNLAALAARLDLPEAAAAEEARRVAAVCRWLNANPGWLLILDNLDTREALQEATALTAGLRGGHVLITSRLAIFPPAVRRLPLDVLETEDAAAFLLERTEAGRRRAADDMAAARDLAVALGGLALALEHAGAYIEARAANLRTYLALWREGNEAVMAWCDPAVSHYERTTAATLQLSVARLTPPARALLERLAFLAPEAIPETLLDGAIPGSAPGEMPAALADLAAYSLTTRDRERPTFTVHRLVQELTRRSLDAEAAATRLGEALHWVNAAFAGEPQDVRSWPVLDPLAPHAGAVAGHAATAGIAAPTARLMNQLGLLLDTKARHAEAEPLYRRALAIDEASLGPDHPEVAIRLNNLAALLQGTNRLAEAEPLFRRVLAIFETSLGADHPNVATALNNLAGLLRATNRLAEAETLSRRMVLIFLEFERQTGHPHPHRDGAIRNYAGILAALGQGEAEIAAAVRTLGRGMP